MHYHASMRFMQEDTGIVLDHRCSTYDPVRHTYTTRLTNLLLSIGDIIIPVRIRIPISSGIRIDIGSRSVVSIGIRLDITAIECAQYAQTEKDEQYSPHRWSPFRSMLSI